MKHKAEVVKNEIGDKQTVFLRCATCGQTVWGPFTAEIGYDTDRITGGYGAFCAWLNHVEGSEHEPAP